MEQELIIKQKKKKKRLTYLSVDFNELQQDEILQTYKEMRIRIYKVMREHIGVENKISSTELFEKVIGVSPFDMDFFKRGYWWNIIKAIIREMRKTGDIFILIKRGGGGIFVLKTEQEYAQLEKEINTHIENLKQMKNNAYEWVKEKKWRKL